MLFSQGRLRPPCVIAPVILFRWRDILPPLSPKSPGMGVALSFASFLADLHFVILMAIRAPLKLLARHLAPEPNDDLLKSRKRSRALVDRAIGT
jgi:hypothetical protein